MIYLIQLTPLLDLDLVSTLIRHGHLFGLKSYLAQAFNMWTRACHNPYCTSLDAFPKSMLDLNSDLNFRPEIIIGYIGQRLWMRKAICIGQCFPFSIYWVSSFFIFFILGGVIFFFFWFEERGGRYSNLPFLKYKSLFLTGKRLM